MLCAAEPGMMGFKEHGELLLKSILRIACHDMGFDYTYCQVPPQQYPCTRLLMSR